jgi:hypothetical protein
MDVLITESQRTLILTESLNDTLKTIHEHGIDFSANLYKRVKKRLGFNFKILLTFGAAVGGLVEPLEKFLEGKYPEMTEQQTLMVIVATTCILFNEGKNILKELLPKIKEEGLEDIFRTSIVKSRKLVTAFRGFLATLGNSTAFLADVIGYIYMIPLVGYLTMAIQGNSMSADDVSKLVERLAAIGVFHITSSVLEEIVNRIIKK